MGKGKEVWAKNIEEVMEFFDFEKAHSVYEAMGWKWFNGPHIPSAVPTLAQIKEAAYEMLQSAIEERHIISSEGPFKYKNAFSSSGGLRAEAVSFRNDAGKKVRRLSLYFIAVQAEGEE